MDSRAIHPGKHVSEDLKELNINTVALRRRLKVPTNCVTDISNRRRAVIDDTALCLGHFLSTSVEFWLHPRQLFELRPAE